MSYLLRMLSLVVCLFLGFISMAVYGYNVSDDQSAVQSAWSCGPVFHEKVVANWQLRQRKANGELESTQEGRERLTKSLLELRRCDDAGYGWHEAFIESYVTFSWNVPGLFGGTNYTGKFRQFQQDEEVIITKISISPSYFEKQVEVRKEIQKAQQQDEDNQKRLEARQEEGRIRAVAEAAAKEAEAAAKEALMTRQSQLKNGSIPVSNYDDAVLLHVPDRLDSLMMSPLLRPNQAIYAGEVTLDGEEAENVLRVKIGGYRNPVWGWVELTYATLRLTKKTIDYSKRSMRIGGTIKVIGRYVQNKKYTTVARQEKTMPVIELMYIGD